MSVMLLKKNHEIALQIFPFYVTTVLKCNVRITETIYRLTIKTTLIIQNTRG